MDAADLYRKVISLVYTPEFGENEAARLAAMPLEERQVAIRRWYGALPSPKIVPYQTHPFFAERQRVTLLTGQMARLRTALEEGEDAASDAEILVALEAECTLAKARMEDARPSCMDPNYVRADMERQVKRLEQILAACPEHFHLAVASARRLVSEPGVERLQPLKKAAVHTITQKNRVLCMLPDLHLRLKDGTDADRESLTGRVAAIEQNHALQIALIDSLKKALRTEAECVCANRPPDMKIWDAFEREVEAFAQLVALRK